MTLREAVRLYFLGFYGIGILIFALQVLPAGLRAQAGEHRVRDARRYLQVILLPVAFLVPPTLILLRLGEINADAMIIRVLGLLVSLFAVVTLPWGAAALGRMLVPQPVIFSDHTLVVRGPYRFVRHPLYAGDLALWLGAGLGTLNVPLLVLWPLYLVGVRGEAALEEELLEAKFGEEYRSYARRVARFVPGLRR